MRIAMVGLGRMGANMSERLVRAGHDVVPLVTPGAERFVAAETFRALARRLRDIASEIDPA